MPARFVVDPYLTTLPARGVDGSNWIHSLRDWLREVRACNGNGWYHFLNCTQLLSTHRRFPTFSDLRRLIRELDLDLNAEIIIGDLQSFFLSEIHDIKSVLPVQDVLARNEVTIQPDEFLNRQDPAIKSVVAAEILLLACREAGLPDDGNACSIVTQLLPEGTLKVDAHLDLTDPDEYLKQLPSCHIQQQLSLLFSPGDMLDHLSSAEIAANGVQGFLQLARLRASRIRPGFKALAGSAGPEFWDSMASSSIMESRTAVDRLIHVAALILSDTARDGGCDLRHLRENVAADAKQKERSRDRARAWRVTITPSGVGWRMNYWRLPDGGIEFGLIQKKQDGERIPE